MSDEQFKIETSEEMIDAINLASSVIDSMKIMAHVNEVNPALTGLIICGLIAGKLVEEGMTRETFFKQMNLAIDSRVNTAEQPIMRQ